MRDPLDSLPRVRRAEPPSSNSRRLDQRKRKEWRVDGLERGVVDALKALGGVTKNSQPAQPTQADRREAERINKKCQVFLDRHPGLFSGSTGSDEAAF